MKDFIIYAIDKNKKKTVFFYSKKDNTLTDKNKIPIIPQRYNPFVFCNKIKDFSNLKIIRIRFAGNCNYRCKYCLQTNDRRDDLWGDPEDFFSALLSFHSNPKTAFSLWGGEPFLYPENFFAFVKAIRKNYPESTIAVSTNGSLLNYDIIDQLVKYKVGIGISHDGPGQCLRHETDFLENFEYRKIINYAFGRLSGLGLISFNPVITTKYNSRLKILEYYDKYFKTFQPRVGEGMLIHPSTPENTEFCFKDFREIEEYMINFFIELFDTQISRFAFPQEYSRGIKKIITNKQPYKYIRNSCGVDNPHLINCSAKGDVLLCTTDILESETSTRKILGNFSAIDDVDLSIFREKFYNETYCSNCLIEHFCGRGCMIALPSVREYVCIARYADIMPLFLKFIYDQTGFLPYKIDGDEIQERQTILSKEGIERIFKQI